MLKACLSEPDDSLSSFGLSNLNLKDKQTIVFPDVFSISNSRPLYQRSVLANAFSRATSLFSALTETSLTGTSPNFLCTMISSSWDVTLTPDIPMIQKQMIKKTNAFIRKFLLRRLESNLEK